MTLEERLKNKLQEESLSTDDSHINLYLLATGIIVEAVRDDLKNRQPTYYNTIDALNKTLACLPIDIEEVRENE